MAKKIINKVIRNKVIRNVGCLVIGSMILTTVLSGCSKSVESSSYKDTSTNVELSNESVDYRPIPLSVSLVDVLGEMGIEIVGVPNSQYELHESAKELPKVGLSMSPDVEKILQLEPTHVLSLTTLKSMVEPKLKAAGIEATYLNADNIDQLKLSIEQIGEIFDKQTEANGLIQRLDAEIKEVVDKAKGEEAVDVLILFGFPGNYMIATNQSFVGQMVELLGANNIANHDQMVYMQMNLEELMVQQPDVILRLAHGDQEAVVKMFEAEFESNEIWKAFEAVQNGRVYDLDDDMFNVSATLDTPEALKELMTILYQ